MGAPISQGGPQNVNILGSQGPKIKKFFGSRGPQNGGPYSHMTPVPMPTSYELFIVQLQILQNLYTKNNFTTLCIILVNLYNAY